MHSPSSRGGLSLVLVVCLAIAAEVDGDEREATASLATAPQARDLPATGPYCGIHCLYAALKVFGKNVDFQNLVEKKYIGSERGSSLAELVLAAQDNGLYAAPLSGLTVSSLKAAPLPMILHVSRSRHGRVFEHWVLFLGEEEGKVRILDAPHPVEPYSFAELQAEWDGIGLVVSDAPITRGPAWLEQVLSNANIILLVAAVVLLLQMAVLKLAHARGLPKPPRKLLLVGGQAGLILLTGAALAGIWHFAAGEGFGRNPQALANVNKVHFSHALPSLELHEVETLLEDPDTVIVDARPARAFDRGHLPSAINVPVNASPAEIRHRLADIPRSARVLVYCQSKGCHWDEQVAAELVWSGYANVALYTGGWAEWQSMHKASQ